MKKCVCFIFLALVCLSLTSCLDLFNVTKYPDMVEYDRKDVIDKAKEKYSFSNVLISDRAISGEKEYDESGKLLIDKISPVKIVNGDNLENAFTSFAGKNGGHDIQGMYKYFICYYGLGMKEDGSCLFFYYNLNINKDVKLEDTIGMSEYYYEIMLNELFHYDVKIPYNLNQIAGSINSTSFNHNSFSFDKDRLSYRSTVRSYLDKDFVKYRVEFYRENEMITYDLFIENDAEDILIYSTSDKYGYIEKINNMDLNEYFNIKCEIEEHDDIVNFDCKSKLKEIDGNVLYCYFYYDLIINEKRDLNSETMHVFGFSELSYDIFFERNYSKEKLEGINYSEITNFILLKFYVFYEKGNN